MYNKDINLYYVHTTAIKGALLQGISHFRLFVLVVTTSPKFVIAGGVGDRTSSGFSVCTS